MGDDMTGLWDLQPAFSNSSSYKTYQLRTKGHPIVLGDSLFTVEAGEALGAKVSLSISSTLGTTGRILGSSFFYLILSQHDATQVIANNPVAYWLKANEACDIQLNSDLEFKRAQVGTMIKGFKKGH